VTVSRTGYGRVRAAVAGAVLALAASASAAPTVASGERPLRVLAGDATVIVLADVARTESFDDDRLQLHRLHVVRVVRGSLDQPEPSVVDIRGGSVRPPLLSAGERVVVLLRPAPRLSYLTQHLEPGEYFEPVAGRDGVVPIASESEVAAVEGALAEGRAIAGLAGDAARSAIRKLAFGELGGPSPRLAADALAELRQLDPFAPLAPAEVEALGRALRDRRVEPVVRVGLIQLVARHKAREALPALATAESERPEVLAALLSARAELGAVSEPAQLAAELGSQDPAVRAAAVRALARLNDPAALAEVGRYATTDEDLGVRLAAVEALGDSRQEAAVPFLTRTFESQETRLMQRSARALLDIDGPAVDDALVNLSLNGGTPTVRRYAAFLVLAAHGRDHPAVRRIESSNPPPEVQRLLEEGLKVKD
jgi:HEAT repeat protein